MSQLQNLDIVDRALLLVAAAGAIYGAVSIWSMIDEMRSHPSDKPVAVESQKQQQKRQQAVEAVESFSRQRPGASQLMRQHMAEERGGPTKFLM